MRRAQDKINAENAFQQAADHRDIDLEDQDGQNGY